MLLDLPQQNALALLQPDSRHLLQRLRRYFSLPVGIPQQMILAERQKFKFIAFETRH